MCLERYIVEQCAPTLASLKTGTMFGVIEQDVHELTRQVAEWQAELAPKGLVLTILRYRGGRAPIYLGRLSQLSRDLAAPGAAELLRCYGYAEPDTENALRRLRERVLTTESFPHEIGLFLGYPLQDVIGFIRDGGKNSKCTGYWQVYGDEQDAVRRFERYRKCSEVYMRLWAGGKSLQQLTVAA